MRAWTNHLGISGTCESIMKQEVLVVAHRTINSLLSRPVLSTGHLQQQLAWKQLKEYIYHVTAFSYVPAAIIIVLAPPGVSLSQTVLLGENTDRLTPARSGIQLPPSAVVRSSQLRLVTWRHVKQHRHRQFQQQQQQQQQFGQAAANTPPYVPRLTQ